MANELHGIKEQIPENVYTSISLNSDSDIMDKESLQQTTDQYSSATTEQMKTKKTNSLQRFFRKSTKIENREQNDDGAGAAVDITTNNPDDLNNYKNVLKKTSSFWKKRSDTTTNTTKSELGNSTSDEKYPSDPINMNNAQKKNSLSRKFNIRIGVPGKRSDSLPKREPGQMNLAQSNPSLSTNESRSTTGLRSIMQSYWNSVFPRKTSVNDVVTQSHDNFEKIKEKHDGDGAFAVVTAPSAAAAAAANNAAGGGTNKPSDDLKPVNIQLNTETKYNV